MEQNNQTIVTSCYYNCYTIYQNTFFSIKEVIYLFDQRFKIKFILFKLS